MLDILKTPLERQGISYIKVQGSLLSGFQLLGFKYQENIKAQKVAFKIDFEMLKQRVLLIDTVRVEKLEIDEQFLLKLIDSNQSRESQEEQNLSLPFNLVMINDAKFSLSKIVYKEFMIKNLDLSLKDVKSDLKGVNEGYLELSLNSNVAKAELNANFHQNQFKVEGKLEGEQLFLNKILMQNEIEVETNPHLLFSANGDINQSTIHCDFTGLKAKQGAFWTEIKRLQLDADVIPKKGDVKLNFFSTLNSFVADGNIGGDIHFNFNDLNETLFLALESEMEVDSTYVNGFVKEHNVTLLEKVPLHMHLKGNMRALDVNLNTSSKLKVHGVISNLKLQTDTLHFDLPKKYLSGAFHLDGVGEMLEFRLKSDLAGDYTQPELLNVDAQLSLLNFNAFGTDLSTLTPIQIGLQKHEKMLNIDFDSERLKLSTQSNDLDKFTFNLESDELHPSKIMKVPEPLDGKYFSSNLVGFLTLSKEFIKLDGKISSSEDFGLNIAIENGLNGLDAKVSTDHLTLLVKGDIQQRDFDFNLKIDSLKKLQKEVEKVYAFEAVPIDGEVVLSGKLEGENLHVKLNSNKLMHEAFNINELKIDAYYEKDLLSVDRLEFILADKNNQNVEQKFYLTKTAKLSLGQKREINLEMYPKISLHGTGTDSSFKATLQLDALKLEHPSYGVTHLSCDIDYMEKDSKIKVLGGVFLDKLKIFYESKFLDPSHDRDIIILKNKPQKKDANDTFLNNVEMDLKVYSEDAQYETPDIDLTFTVNLDIDKQLRENIRILGRIEEIEGEVEQAPKLFKIEESNIVFTGAKEINPLLDLRIQYELPDVLIMIDIRGNAKRPKLIFSSEPSLPKKDILSYLLLGVSTANMTEGEGSLSREAELFIMNQAARDLAHDVDLDRVLIKDDGTGEGYNLQIGKKMSDETMFIIEKNREGNSFILEYDIDKNMKVEVGQHQKVIPSQSIDFYYRKKFK
jgi:hypothetical protein